MPSSIPPLTLEAPDEWTIDTESQVTTPPGIPPPRTRPGSTPTGGRCRIIVAVGAGETSNRQAPVYQ